MASRSVETKEKLRSRGSTVGGEHFFMRMSCVVNAPHVHRMPQRIASEKSSNAMALLRNPN